MAGVQLSGEVCEALSPAICTGRKGRKEGSRQAGRQIFEVRVNRLKLLCILNTSS